MGGELPSRPGQVESSQYSQLPCIRFPLESTAVAHQGLLSPSIVVHLSLCLCPKMKGKTQFPQLPVVLVLIVVVVVGAVVVLNELLPSLQTEDSSPSAAMENLFSLITRALSDRPTTPVSVPVSG